MGCPDFNSSYGRGCRCSFCRKKISITENKYRLRVLEKERGITHYDDLIDAHDTHVMVRNAIQWKWVRLTELQQWTGIGRPALTAIRDGKTKRIRRHNADAIQKAIENRDMTPLKGMTRVSSKRACAIALGLCAQGWTLEHQREILQRHRNVSGGFILSITQKKYHHTYAVNEEHMEWLAKTIGERQGPSRQSKYQMKARGIFPVKHYSLKGDLIVQSLSADQRAIRKRVQSTHD